MVAVMKGVGTGIGPGRYIVDEESSAGGCRSGDDGDGDGDELSESDVALEVTGECAIFALFIVGVVEG
jgi:hypothetical protein